MKKHIEKRIKQLFGTQEIFCAKYGYRYGDFASKKRTVENQFNFVNNFLKPLGLEIRVVMKRRVIECVKNADNDLIASAVTIGNRYDVIQKSDNFYLIIDDNGGYYHYAIDLFVEI